jgi:carbamate kinase
VADGGGIRRVVPSPEPLGILGLPAVRALLHDNQVVICAGGGGVPVVRRGGRLCGVEAVVDKDLAAALLAVSIGADALLLLTDVPVVQADWGTPCARDITTTAPWELRRITFAAGSMGPKVEAACRFVEATRGVAGIGALADAGAILRGDAGTRIAAPERLTREQLDAEWQT